MRLKFPSHRYQSLPQGTNTEMRMGTFSSFGTKCSRVDGSPRGNSCASLDGKPREVLGMQIKTPLNMFVMSHAQLFLPLLNVRELKC